MKKFMLALSLSVAAATAWAQATPAAKTTAPTSKKAAAAAWTEDGLQKASIKGIDVAFVRPGASLAPYRKVLLRPIDVSFRRDWGRTTTGTGVRVRPQDAQRIRDRLEALIREETVRELASGGYTVVEQAGDDVLEIEAAIQNLYLVAPDALGAEATRVYSVSAGEMTLVADLRDSISGDTVMRVYDHAEATDNGRIHRITYTENAIEARRIAKAWAGILRKQLDAARGVSAPAKK